MFLIFNMKYFNKCVLFVKVYNFEGYLEVLDKKLKKQCLKKELFKKTM